MPNQVETLKTMYNSWPFFKNLVDRTDLALHKANMPLAEQYAELDPPSKAIFEHIKQEFHTTQEMIHLIKLGEEHPKTERVKQGVLARKDLRSWAQTMQVELIRAVRDAGQGVKAEQLKPLLVQTMQANANSIGRFG
jgi:phosphoenolpyruvate carboxylase